MQRGQTNYLEGHQGGRDYLILFPSYLVAPVQGILPTALILLLTLVVMLTVIPYAFSNVLRQMEAVRALEEAELSRQEGAENLDPKHLTNIKNSVEDL